MPQLIRPQEVKVITRDGEVQVSLTIDLNINLNGGVEVASVRAVQEKAETPKANQETYWAIPEFEPAPRIQFGKKE